MNQIKEFIEKVAERKGIKLNMPETGLELGDNTPDRTIECPECKADYDFNTKDLEWEHDGTFAFSDVVCEECNNHFQICALSNGREYEFFAT